MEKLLLHCCCAPCANQPIDHLLANGYQLEVFFGNSNIHYQAEYERRRDSLRDYVASFGLPYHEADYQTGDWFQAIRNDGGVFALLGNENDEGMLERRKVRCRLCYRHRFRALANKARELGINTIATTLAVSPYQFNTILAEELDTVASEFGITALFEDWRPLYRMGQDKARELGFYRQKYCGCEFSHQEADIERQVRAAAKV